MEERKCVPAPEQEEERNKAGARSRADSIAVRPLLRPLVFLAFPTIVEEVLATLLQYVDTAMVGRLGEQATASVSITTNVTWLVNSVPGAIGTAVLVLISKALGAGDEPVSYTHLLLRYNTVNVSRVFQAGRQRKCWRKRNGKIRGRMQE